MSTVFRKKSNRKMNYVDQGYIFFASRRFAMLPKEQKKAVLDCCKQSGGEYWEALFDYVTTEKTADSVCEAHYISKETLYRAVRRYYQSFNLCR